jgi:hypothetical protein
MDSGKYNRHLLVERPTETKSGDFNEVVPTFSSVGNVWGKRLSTSAKEVRNGVDTQVSVIMYEVRDFDIQHEDVITDNNEGQQYKVETVTQKDDDHLIITLEHIQA